MRSRSSWRPGSARARVAWALLLGCLAGTASVPPVTVAAAANGTPLGPHREGRVASIEVVRTAGADRVETSVRVSQAHFETATTVVLASAGDPVDALVGVPVAAQVAGPLILVPGDSLPGAVAEELRRLGVRDVVVLGGEGAVSAGVETTLRDGGFRVQRVSGATRIETAAEAARRFPGRGIGATVVSAYQFADALAAGVPAASTDDPVLLTELDRLSPATLDVLLRLRRQADAETFYSVHLVGGPHAVTPEIQAELERREFPTFRIAGADRLETGAMVWDDYYQRVPHGESDRWLVDAYQPADALSAGAAAAHAGASLLLVDGRDLLSSRAVVERLRTARTELERIELIGGTATISVDAFAQLEVALLQDDVDAPRCEPDSLRATLRNANGALGTQYQAVEIVNVSPQVCTLQGRVAVTLLDDRGDPLRTETLDAEDDVFAVPLAPDGRQTSAERGQAGQARVMLSYLTWPTVQECYEDPSRVVRARQLRIELGEATGRPGVLLAQGIEPDTMVEACRGRLLIEAIEDAR